jgi:hypothetical protein
MLIFRIISSIFLAAGASLTVIAHTFLGTLLDGTLLAFVDSMLNHLG